MRRCPSSLCSRPRPPPYRAAAAAGLRPCLLPVTANGGVRGHRGQFVDRLARSATWTATAPLPPVISFRVYKRPAGITRQRRGYGGAPMSRRTRRRRCWSLSATTTSIKTSFCGISFSLSKLFCVMYAMIHETSLIPTFLNSIPASVQFIDNAVKHI